MESFVKRFSKLEHVSYSTNISTKQLAQNSIDFYKEILRVNKLLDRKISLELQLSFDGVPELNDYNRVGSNSTETINSITYLLSEIKDFSKIRIHFKGTYSSESLRYLMQKDNLANMYRFWEKNYSEWIKIVDERNLPTQGEAITVVFPGNYSQEDGKNFTKLLKKIDCLFETPEFKEFKYVKNHCQFESNLRNWKGLLSRNFRRIHKNELSNCISCSAGRSSFGLDFNHNYSLCHGIFFLDNEMRDFLKKNHLESEFTQKFGYPYDSYDLYIKNKALFNFRTDPELKQLRILNTLKQNQMYFPTSLQFAEIMIKELAASGQISSEYYSNEELRNSAISFFSHGGGCNCPLDALWETGTFSLSNISSMRLYLNGAFEYYMRTLK